MRSFAVAAAALAAFLLPDLALAKDPPPSDRTRPPERHIGPIIGPWRPIIGIPPCLVDVKIPCEGNGRPVLNVQKTKTIQKRKPDHARNR
ncbi:MAG: hypothetical protein Q9M33_13735 [Robiginitomaculum sp.]|nr:hypothetical protein [Robiginitomaculum sp.]